MKTEEATRVLRDYNLWRRGDEDMDQPDSREIGEAIDSVLVAIQKVEADLDEAREQRDRLAEIAKQFVSILDITEQIDGGRLFHPTNITSCRAGDLQKIGELVEALRRASKTDRIIRNAEIAELDRLKEEATRQPRSRHQGAKG